jgi:hypothetical protein
VYKDEIGEDIIDFLRKRMNEKEFKKQPVILSKKKQYGGGTYGNN